MHVGLYIKGKTFCNKGNSGYDVWSKYIQQSPLLHRCLREKRKKTMENYLSMRRIVDVNVMKSYQTRSLMKCYCTVLIKKNVYTYIYMYIYIYIYIYIYTYINKKNLKVSCELPFLIITRFAVLTARAWDITQPRQSRW